MSPAQTLVLLIVACVFGLVGYLIGRGKGYPAWGFFCGFLLSLIGIVIIAVVKPKAGRAS